MDVVRVSKRLSYVLRHRPESVGLTLDEAGPGAGSTSCSPPWAAPGCRSPAGSSTTSSPPTTSAVSRTTRRLARGSAPARGTASASTSGTRRRSRHRGPLPRHGRPLRLLGAHRGTASREPARGAPERRRRHRPSGRAPARGRPVVLSVDAAAMAAEGAVVHPRGQRRLAHPTPCPPGTSPSRGLKKKKFVPTVLSSNSFFFFFFFKCVD